MKTFINSFLRDEQGQDLIEYTLLLAFVALASAALFIGAGNSVKGIWSLDECTVGCRQLIRQLDLDLKRSLCRVWPGSSS